LASGFCETNSHTGRRRRWARLLAQVFCETTHTDRRLKGVPPSPLPHRRRLCTARKDRIWSELPPARLRGGRGCSASPLSGLWVLRS
jgi:hypothetical protein